MKNKLIAIAFALLLLCNASAKSSHHASGHASHHASHHASASRCSACARNSRGRIQRSRQAIRSFRSTHPCPATGKTTGACHGYVIDHVQALRHGGKDAPSNMQWQTTAAAKAKDRIE
jgi:hypothetical protein